MRATSFFLILNKTTQLKHEESLFHFLVSTKSFMLLHDICFRGPWNAKLQMNKWAWGHQNRLVLVAVTLHSIIALTEYQKTSSPNPSCTADALEVDAGGGRSNTNLSDCLDDSPHVLSTTRSFKRQTKKQHWEAEGIKKWSNSVQGVYALQTCYCHHTWQVCLTEQSVLLLYDTVPLMVPFPVWGKMY